MTHTLQQFNELPEGFLNVKAQDLHTILERPSLIHLPGKNPRILFISTLLHGNETTGLYAIQKLLQQYLQTQLPRSISVFVGNIKAAQAGVRRLEQQVDYNRIWPGSAQPYLAEAHLMQQVTDIMREKDVWASVDIHNNTGKNPHYSCINKLQKEFICLAGLFSDTLVYFTSPKGVQSSAFAELCPSVTLECGLSGEETGIDHAVNYLQKVIKMSDAMDCNIEHLNLYHTVVRVKIPEGYSFGFEDDATINLLPEIEAYNFSELKAGTELAFVEPDSSAYLQAFDDDEREVGRDFFEYPKNKIVLKKSVMPAMLTMNTQVIRQDCLCYLMERMELPEQLI